MAHWSFDSPASKRVPLGKDKKQAESWGFLDEAHVEMYIKQILVLSLPTPRHLDPPPITWPCSWML